MDQEPSTASSSSAPSDNHKTNDDEERNRDDHIYECNICLDTARDAVISMCGHLFCWPCLHQWLETRPNKKVCPVCKSGISRDKVIPLYGRGSSNQEDPRNKVPPRPSGQRAEAETGSGFGGFGFGDGSFHFSIGIGAFPFNFIISTFNVNAHTTSVSNVLPEQPVLSPVSGNIFERRLIEKYITENGTDPINGESLTVEQLIEVKTNPVVKPIEQSTTSIPAILKLLQQEWDAVMLNSFTQRQQLQTARQELSHALYQHDAACRVIGRLSKEVLAAREALATLKPQAQSATTIPQPAVAAEAPTFQTPTGLTVDIIKKLQDKAEVLTRERKKRGRNVPEELMPQDYLKNFRMIATYPALHSVSPPGILSLDIHAADTSKIVTGGNDKNATVFNKDSEQVIAVLKGHTKKVTKVIYHPEEDIVFTASPDTTIRVWNVGTSQSVQILRAHDAPINGLSLHPTGDYVLSSSDQHWAFSDIRSGRVLTKVTMPENQGESLTIAQFHPDGLIFGTGTSDAQIKIWDLKDQNDVANFPGHTGPITAMSFSENGYYLATAAEDCCVRLWDLRKLNNFRTIPLEEGHKVKDLCFDQSGMYLAVAGTDVRVYLCKQWQELNLFQDYTDLATGVRFGKHAQYIATSSMDRTLKLYGLK